MEEPLSLDQMIRVVEKVDRWTQHITEKSCEGAMKEDRTRMARYDSFEKSYRGGIGELVVEISYVIGNRFVLPRQGSEPADRRTTLYRIAARVNGVTVGEYDSESAPGSHVQLESVYGQVRQKCESTAHTIARSILKKKGLL